MGIFYHIISTGFLPGFLNHQQKHFRPPKKRHFFGDVLHSTSGNKLSGHHRSLSYGPRELLPPPSPTPPTDLSKNSLEKCFQVRNPKQQTMEIQCPLPIFSNRKYIQKLVDVKITTLFVRFPRVHRRLGLDFRWRSFQLHGV